MNIQQIIAFDESVKYGSITKASEAMHVTASGLRLSLHRLEDEFGVSLIQWGSHHFTLTEYGEFFLQQAREMRKLYGNCINYFCAPEDKVVKIVSGPNFPSDRIGDVFYELKQKYPDIKNICTEHSGYACDEFVSRGEAELGLNTGPFDEQEFSYFPLFSFSLIFAINRKNPLARQPSLPIEALGTYQIITSDTKNSDTAFVDLCRQHGVEPQVAMKCLRDSVIFRMVSVNPAYIGVTNQEFARILNFPDIVTRPFSIPDFRKTVYLYHKKRVKLSPYAQLTKRTFLEKAAQHAFDSNSLV